MKRRQANKIIKQMKQGVYRWKFTTVRAAAIKNWGGVQWLDTVALTILFGRVARGAEQLAAAFKPLIGAANTTADVMARFRKAWDEVVGFNEETDEELSA